MGVIVRLERENFHVLGMHGKVIECKPTALQKRRENQNTVALDSEQNQIRRRDIVKVLEGPHAGRDGEIKHLYRSLAFLHSRMYTENGGIFVCKTRHLKLAGGNKNSTNLTNQMGMAGFSVRIKRFSFSSTKHSDFFKYDSDFSLNSLCLREFNRQCIRPAEIVAEEEECVAEVVQAVAEFHVIVKLLARV